jgi:hypothetical protein
MCSSGSCALRSEGRRCPGSSDPIPGTWFRSTSGENTGKFDLTSCPAWYQKKNTSHDTQTDHPCSERQYIINPDEDTCERCPPGLECRDDNKVVPVVENSTWLAENGLYKLLTCLTGYSKTRVDGEWDQQKCGACDRGSDCVLNVCETCSPCAAGTHKDVKGTQFCRPCPVPAVPPPAPRQVERYHHHLQGQTNSTACKCGDRFYLTSKDNDGKIACKACPMVQNVVTGNVHFDKIPLLVESMEDGSESLIRESGQRITAVMARRRRRRHPGGHTTAVSSGGRRAPISTDTASHTHTARSLACPLLTLSSARPFSNGIFRSNGAPASLPPASSSLTHARRMDGFCNQNAD